MDGFLKLTRGDGSGGPGLSKIFVRVRRLLPPFLLGRCRPSKPESKPREVRTVHPALGTLPWQLWGRPDRLDVYFDLVRLGCCRLPPPPPGKEASESPSSELRPARRARPERTSCQDGSCSWSEPRFTRRADD
ncbi:hypothetical protein MTO96_011152 [Rhipicephalus appendiculatus]